MGEVTIKLTPTKVEQLELIRKYDRAFDEPERPIEDIAREILYSGITSRYKAYKELQRAEVKERRADNEH